ncbi:nuclear transport factor 2 family protein [Nocardia huaxiensis]|uniref:Nuclear transport factor 2 family protein n=1 Tax=Nocardia huaxiensis TaxID=2755382 RepID=A0A7D6ZNH4_9NOCA|nr:nuclear transport factor 2 family protein [Nocardia huaxiensis]QLY29745.1 nuclear transport factor 2 family protein [Nocardia huaxiensis]UFS96670.1 nuclear transport factor 2 family protein [Nocardia huaxiensis]
MDTIALEQIRALKHRYLRTLDLKQWDDFGDTLCTDVVGSYGSPSGGGPLEFTDREALVGYMRGALSGNIITVHVANHPEIEVDGETARGTWCLEDTVIVPDFDILIRGAAYYHDTYRREDGVWRIASTAYQRIFEAKMSTDALPGFALTANRWAEMTAPQ